MLGLYCVRCSEPLFGEWYHGISIERCLKCRGCWVDHARLGSLISRRTRMFTTAERNRLKNLRDRLQKDRAYSPSRTGCPRCSGLMEHWEYKKSGVVLDRCADHGTWFDEGELEHVQLAAERGDEAAPRNRPKEVEAVEADLSPIEETLRTTRTEYDVRLDDGEVVARYRTQDDSGGRHPIKSSTAERIQIFDSLSEMLDHVKKKAKEKWSRLFLEESPPHRGMEQMLKEDAQFAKGRTDYVYDVKSADGKLAARYRVWKNDTPPKSGAPSAKGEVPMFDELDALYRHMDAAGHGWNDLRFEGEPVFTSSSDHVFVSSDEMMSTLKEAMSGTSKPGDPPLVHELKTTSDAKVFLLPDDPKEKERFLQQLTEVLFPEGRPSKGGKGS